MIIFDREKLEYFLGRVSTGFGATPFQMVLFVAVIVAIIAFLMSSYLLLRRRENRRLARAIRVKNDDYFTRFYLDKEELELIDAMSAYLKDPRKKYLLLAGQTTFASCLQKLREHRDVDAELTTSLQKKLGFDLRRQLQRLRNTADLTEGTPVILEMKGIGKIAGSIVEKRREAFGVEPRDRKRMPAPGVPVVVYTHDPRGVFAFSTSVNRVQNGRIFLTHSGEIKRAQRRTYYRRPMRIEVVVKREGSNEKPKPTIMLDLGGGGASLRNPAGSLSKGDELRIFLNKGHQDWLPVGGEVVRLSDNGGVAHIRFSGLEERRRDEIIRIVNRGSV